MVHAQGSTEEHDDEVAAAEPHESEWRYANGAIRVRAWSWLAAMRVGRHEG
jgi:hypothetical protein